MRLFYILNTFLAAFMFCEAESCWFSSKSGAIKHIDRYMRKVGKDPEEGLDHGDFEDIIKQVPGSIRWAVKKLGNIQGVFDRCDYDGDGKIKLSEVGKSNMCLTSCWKQSAIMVGL